MSVSSGFASTTWEEAKINAKTLQNETEHALQALGRLQSSIASAASSGSALSTLDSQIQIVSDKKEEAEQLLREMGRVIKNMSSLGDHLGSVKHAQVSRWREIHVDLQRAFSREIESIESIYQRATLLGCPREKWNQDLENGEMELLAQRAALDDSRTMMDQILRTAESTQGLVRSQVGRFGNITGKLRDLSSRVPGMDQLIRKIGKQKSRDTLILSFVAACCIVIIVLYRISR